MRRLKLSKEEIIRLYKKETREEISEKVLRIVLIMEDIREQAYEEGLMDGQKKAGDVA